jgi:membrane protein/epoxyqueuosine reductase
MFENGLGRRLIREVKNLVPLFRYLILQTETHSFCLALAGAALLGFFPTCLVMLAVFKNVLRWQGAYDVLLNTVTTYFPVEQDFVVRNLKAQLTLHPLGNGANLAPLLWVLLGAAGVFIPLETALNRLWRVTDDRPYWLNQAVGCTLTVVCTLLGLLFLSISTALHRFVPQLPLSIVRGTARFIIIRSTMTCFFIVTIFALYKFLPNTKIAAKQVLPAAILAGMLAELVRIIFVQAVPDLTPTQGPFAISVTFLLLVYFETFVILGCAFLASQTERYPWVGFLPLKRAHGVSRHGSLAGSLGRTPDQGPSSS